MPYLHSAVMTYRNPIPLLSIAGMHNVLPIGLMAIDVENALVQVIDYIVVHIGKTLENEEYINLFSYFNFILWWSQ